MCALASVFFHVRALNTNASTARKIEVTIRIQWKVVLTDLIRLWLVRIEVVLAVKDALLNGAVQRSTNTHSQFHCMLVEHRKCTRQAQGDRVDVHIWFITKTVGRTTEQLCLCCKLNVNFQPNNHFPTARKHLLFSGNNGTQCAVAHCAPPAATSNAPPTRNIASSPSAGANT